LKSLSAEELMGKLEIYLVMNNASFIGLVSIHTYSYYNQV